MKLFFRMFALHFLSLPLFVYPATLSEDNDRLARESTVLESFYRLGKNEKWRDITEQVLNSPDTIEENKECIRAHQRRIIVFQYPSDGLSIKGFITFTPSPTHHPLLILYRGGNGSFGLLNPSIIYAIYGNYTVISSTLRGGVSQGEDEFGGSDVNDIKNLIDFIPQLSQELGIELKPPCTFMLGLSRGGLEMFLTLARFPELQNRINKIVSLSAVLDLHRFIQDRALDAKPMLEQHYGLTNKNQNEWIAKRDPLQTVPLLKKSLPILIVQGTADQRVSLEEGRKMNALLQQNEKTVNYWEIPHGTHVLLNNPRLMSQITQWLESNSACLSIKIPQKSIPPFVHPKPIESVRE